MKAVIMAGGEGTRLRPVTGELPKPMAPLLGRPMLEHIVRLLKKHGFTDICAALKYRAEDIERAFGDGAALGVHMQYRVEREALGTAGGVKNCADFYGDEDFLVISGDAACDLDLSRLMREHRESDAAVTLALHRSREPLSYGLAVTDGNGDVRCFIEKPQWSRVVTDLVNTGIYIISPRVMELVPGGVSFDLAAKSAAVGSTPLPFTKSEYSICELLALHAGQTFGKEQIYEAVFGYDGTADDTAITQHIKNIRAKLRAAGLASPETVLKTVWGVGYLWNAADA